MEKKIIRKIIVAIICGVAAVILADALDDNLPFS